MNNIIVYKIEYEGRSFLDTNIDFILQLIKDSDNGDSYTITKKVINKEDYENLEEFEGF